MSPPFRPKLPLINNKNGEQVVDSHGNVYEYNLNEDEWIYRGQIKSPPTVNDQQDGIITPDIYRKLVLLQELIDRGVDFSLFKLNTAAPDPYFYYFYSSDDLIKFAPEQFITNNEVLFTDAAISVFPDRVDAGGFVKTLIRSGSISSTKYFVVDEFAGLRLEMLDGKMAGAVFEIAGNSEIDIAIWGNADQVAPLDNFMVIRPGRTKQQLRVEIDRARLYTKLVRNCCVGPKGIIGETGNAGLDGTPADNEIFQLPTSTKNGIFTFSALVNTPIDTPISLRVFRGLTEIFELLFPLQPSVQEMVVNVIDSSLKFEQTSIEVVYDPTTTEFSGSIQFTAGASDISTWTFKARQRGPKGPQGDAGKGFFDIATQVVDDPAVQGISAIVSLRKQFNDSIVYTQANLFATICVPHLSSNVGQIPAGVIDKVVFTALQVTTKDCKNIGKFIFSPDDFTTPDLDIPLWTPTADCVQAKRWSQYKFDWWNSTADKYLFNISPTPKPPEQCCQEDFFFCPNVGDNPCGVNVEHPIEPPNIPVPCSCECASPIEQELTAGCVVLTPIDMTTQPGLPASAQIGNSTGSSVQRTCNIDPITNLGAPGTNVANLQYATDGTPITPRNGITQQSDGDSIAGVINGVTNEFTQEITVQDNCTVQISLIYDPDICGGESQERQGCEYNDASSVNSTFILEDIGDGSAVITDGGQAETTSIPSSVSFTVTPTVLYESGDLENTQAVPDVGPVIENGANTDQPSIPVIPVAPTFSNQSPQAGVIDVNDCPPPEQGQIVDGPGAATSGGSTVSRDFASGSGFNPSTAVTVSAAVGVTTPGSATSPTTRKLRLTALVNTTKVNYCRGYRLIIIITCLPPTTLTGSEPVTLTGSEPFTVTMTTGPSTGLTETFLTGPGTVGEIPHEIDCPTGSNVNPSEPTGPPHTLTGNNSLTAGEYEIQLPSCTDPGEQASTVVIAIVTDPIGNPVPGAVVQFSTELPSIIVPQLVVTDNNGNARATHILPLESGTFQVTATGVSAPNNLPFEGVVVQSNTVPGSCTAPVIESFTPSSQDAGGAVIITGTGFRNVTTVFFGGGPSATVESATDSQIVAIVPPGSTSGAIIVTTPVGTGSLNGFTLLIPIPPTPAPIISNFSPTSQIAGQNVVINGTNLTGATLVEFGGGPSATIIVNTGIQIVATVPIGSTSGNILVSTPGGVATLPGFTFIPNPVITGFSPSSQGASQSVVITGTGLGGASNVTFGGGPSAAIIFNSTVQIIALVPGGSASGNVSVVTPGGTITSPGFIFIQAPTITSFTPSSQASGSSVTINGTNLTGVTTVTFGGGPAATITFNNSVQVIVTVPIGSASGSVSVATPGGSVSMGGFTFIAPPIITSFSPTHAAVGALVDIFGTNLSTATGVTFGSGPSAVPSIVGGGHIQVTVPSGSLSGSVSVVTTGGSTSSGGFTCTPTITDVRSPPYGGPQTNPPNTIGIGSGAPFSPPNPAPGGGQHIQINGTNLAGLAAGSGYGINIGDAPTVSGQPVNGTYIISATYTQVVFAVPAAGYFSGAPLGNYIKIVTPDGTLTVNNVVYLG